MAEKMINMTGIFAGIKVSEKHRGKFVLLSRGKVIRASTSLRVLVREAKKLPGKPLMMRIPKDSHALAAY